ncbi:uncharacterized protein LOC117124248 [Anneissia japonica]|uniref:uncharacterized protein LOC117124248 n=1 Tax=Anneissia japonica TaxID=1529436 RepID=UPI0014254DFF|nr:uncharacterized protein LOC117124248 [Anneissia japonica]
MFSTTFACLLVATVCRSYEIETVNCYECDSADNIECTIDSPFLHKMKTIECKGLCFNSTVTAPNMVVEARGCISNSTDCTPYNGCTTHNTYKYCFNCCTTNFCNTAHTISPMELIGMLLTISMHFINWPY